MKKYHLIGKFILIFVAILFILLICADIYADKLFTSYDIINNKGEIDKPFRFDSTKKYYVPQTPIDKTDVLISYGIESTACFEEVFAELYSKPAFGFDCGIDKYPTRTKRFKFIPKCLGTDKFVPYCQDSTKNIDTSFEKELKDINVFNKKIFIKMNMAGAIYYVIDDVLKQEKNITGLTCRMQVETFKQYIQSLIFLHKMRKNFKLVYISADGDAKQTIPFLYCLTFVNKNLITDSQKSKIQSESVIKTKPSNILLFYLLYIQKVNKLGDFQEKAFPTNIDRNSCPLPNSKNRSYYIEKVVPIYSEIYLKEYKSLKKIRDQVNSK